MKLFENGVGRPSNEIKRKRKIFIASAIILCIVLVSVLAFALTKVGTGKLMGNLRPGGYMYLPGETTAKPIYTKDNTGLKNLKVTSIWCNPRGKKCDDRSINLYFSSKGTYARQMSYVICFNESDCKSNNAWDIAIAENRHSTSNVKTGGYTMYMDDENRTIEGRTFYARITTYTSANASDWTNVYVLKFKPTNYTKDGTNRWVTSSEIVWSKYNTNKITTTATKATPKLTLTCRAESLNTNAETDCAVTSGGKAVTGYSVTINNQSIKAGKTITGAALFTKTGEANKNKFWLKFYDKLNKNSAFSISTSGNKFTTTATIKVTKSGYTAASDTIKITGNASSSSGTTAISLTCPTSAKTNEPFKCTTDQAGVTITLGGAKSLASGYSSSFTTTASDKSKDIKYADKLFTDYKSQIKKDSNGNEYIRARVDASKSGYKTTTKIVNIYRGSTSNNSGNTGNSGNNNSGDSKPTTKEITLTCPGSAKIDEKVQCKTNQAGVKITLGGAKSLASGIKSSFTTTSSDKTKDVKYAERLFTDYKSIINKDSDGKEYINAKVTASMSGQKDVVKYIKIYRKSTPKATNKPLKLSCTDKVDSGSKATCHVTSGGEAVGGAKIEIASSSTGSITKHSKDVQTHYVTFNETLFTKYNSQVKKDSNGKKYIKAKVTATVSGYKKATEYIYVYDDGFQSDEVYYGIYKVMKEDVEGYKNLEFKINRVGQEAKKVQFIVCMDRNECVDYNPNADLAKTDLLEAKVGNVYDLNVFTEYDELLDQRFFVRMISYNEKGEEIYFKVHEFYTNKVTDKKSINESSNNEEDVVAGDFTATSHDLIVSEHSLVERKNGKLTYGVPSIVKMDNNGKKKLNIFIRSWANEVKYVTYVVCNKESDCNSSDAIEQVSKNNEIGSVQKDVEVSRGKKIEILLNSKSSNLLNQKVYVRIYTYDANKKPLYTMMHSFTTSDVSKYKTKKESDIVIGERALTASECISQKVFPN